MSSILGHQKQKKQLFDLYKQSRIPPVLIFVGSPGIGKSSLAQKFAQLCLSGTSPLEFDDFNSVSLLSPNIRYVDFENEDSSAQSIRRLVGEATLNAALGEAKFFIFNDVDKLTTSAFNILLKTLEEPSKNTHFLLITSALFDIPATIRSRSQIIRFGDLSKETIKQVLDISNNDPVIDRMIDVGGQRLDITRLLLEHEDIFIAVAELISQVEKGSNSACYAFLQVITKDNALNVITILIAYVRYIVTSGEFFSKDAEFNKIQFARACFIQNLATALKLIRRRNIPHEQVILSSLVLYSQTITNKKAQVLLSDYR
jgi:hypothetical protein